MTQFTDLYFKVATLAAFDAMAKALGWLDAEGNEDGSKVTIARITDLCLTPAVFDAEGEVVTPAEMAGPHVNVRIRGAAPAAFDFDGIERMTPDNPRYRWL